MSLPRRDFLKLGSLAAVGLASPLRAKDEIELPTLPYSVGVQTYTFREFDLEPMLQRTKALGLKAGEFYSKHIPPNSTPAQLAAIKKLCAEYGVKPISFGVQGFSKNHDANAKFFDFAQELGVGTISADPDPDSFDSLDKLVDKTKIAIAIHPHGPAGGGKLHRWYSAESIMKAVKDHHPLIGSCLDTGHLIRAAQLGAKLDPAEQVRVMGDRNFGMHLKDHDNAKNTDVVFGKGVLNVPSILKALADVKFKGYIAIEYEANPKDPSPDVKACLEVFRDAVAKKA